MFPRPYYHQRALAYLAFAVLACALLAIQLSHFRGYNYRQDEAWMVMDILTRWQTQAPLDVLISLLMSYPPEQVWLTLAVPAFGHHEAVLRYASALQLTLALALLFRAGADAHDRRTGLWAVFLLGSAAFVQFFGAEVRQYSGLLLGVAGATHFLQAWLRRPTRWRALGYALSVVWGVYSHPFMVYYAFAQGLALLPFLRWNVRLLAQVVALFGASALLSSPRLWQFVSFYSNATDLGYTMGSDLETLRILYEQMHFRPEAFTPLLLGVGLFAPVRRRLSSPFLRGGVWHKWANVGVFVATLATALAINAVISNITPRNLIILLPPLALLGAWGLRQLPTSAGAIIAALMLAASVQGYRPYVANGPYLEMAQAVSARYEAGDKLVIVADWMWQHVPITYYARYRTAHDIPKGALYHVLPSWQTFNLFAFPDTPTQVVDERSPAFEQVMRAHVGDAPTVWLLLGADVVGTAARLRELEALLGENYALNASYTWEKANFYGAHRVLAYERLPDAPQTLALVDERTALVAWAWRGDVNVRPCASTTLATWWQAQQPARANLALEVAIASADGTPLLVQSALINNTQAQLWQEGAFVLDERTLTLPCDAPEGDYALVLTLRDNESGRVLPLTSADGAGLGSTFYLTTLFVRP
jgi:hypothetical protein